MKSSRKRRTEVNASKETPVAQSSESESSDDHMSVHDSSDESINLGEDTFGNGIIMDEPEINSWVGVKIIRKGCIKQRQKKGLI